MFISIRKILILIVFSFILQSNLVFSDDTTNDSLQNSLDLRLSENNYFFYINNIITISINDDLELLYNRPSDRWYPRNDLLISSYYTIPVNRNFGLGPSLFSQVLLYLSNDEDAKDYSTLVNFEAVILCGISFVFTPYIPVINKPAFFLFIDFGPAAVFNNNRFANEDFTAMIGGYTSQTIVLPLFPIYLFVIDMNLVSILRSVTPAGPMPGLRIRNQFLLKFGFMNFIDNRIRVGLICRNTFSFILTGNPLENDLKNQYTYNRLALMIYWDGFKGLQLETGYGFEYYTYANESSYHTAHKFINTLKFSRNGFEVSFKHSLNFWSSGIQDGQPVNEFELGVGYKIERF